MNISNQVNQFCIRIESYEKYIFSFLVVLMLWPIWVNKYFLTLDGPCHLYNSYVLLDFWRGISKNFFLQFYDVNSHIDPNWFSHIVLAILMRFFPPLLSEKIFISSYVLGFLLFSRWLISHINSSNKILSLIPFLFVYHHVFQMGFYNFSFSLVWMIFSWWFFLKFMQKWPIYIFLPLSIIFLMITYLAHPIGYLLTCATLCPIILVETLSERSSLSVRFRKLVSQFSVLFLSMLPSILLIAYFIFRRSSSSGIWGAHTDDTLGNNLIHLTSIVNLDSHEIPIAKFIYSFLRFVAIIGLYFKIRYRSFNKFDVFLLLTIALIGFYLNAPESIAGVGTVYDRYQIIPFVVLTFWLASIDYPRWMKISISGIAIILILSLMAVRIPIHKACSEAVTEYASTAKYIKSESTVIPLSYAHGGKTPDGKTITDMTWIFFHAADYIGTTTPLVMLGNYEGNTGYFPLLWKAELNPFVHLCKDDGIESIPPSIEIENYEKVTQKKVDYVILLCLDEQFMKDPKTIDLLEQLKKGYTKTFVSEHGRAILYKRNDTGG